MVHFHLSTKLNVAFIYFLRNVYFLSGAALLHLLLRWFCLIPRPAPLAVSKPGDFYGTMDEDSHKPGLCYLQVRKVLCN